MSPSVELHRSGVLVVDAATTVDAALALMASANVGSLVVTTGGKIDGIFTERDVLRRFADLSTPAARASAIGTWATRPVFSLTVAQVAEAPRAMLARGIRHVPLVDEAGQQVGIVSMRDILAAQLAAGTLPSLVPSPRPRLRSHAAEPAAPAPHAAPDGVAATPLSAPTLHVLAPTAQLVELCRRFLPHGWRSQIWTSVRSIENLPGLADPSRRRAMAFMLDLDGIPDRNWRPLLKRFIALLTSGDQPDIFLVASPMQYPERELRALAAVAEKARWRIYQRPLPVMALAQHLGALPPAASGDGPTEGGDDAEPTPLKRSS